MNFDASFVPLHCSREPGAWIFSEEGRTWLENEVLPRWLPTRRWFGGKARAISRVAIESTVPVLDTQQVLVVRVEYATGEPDRYAVPLGWSATEDGVLARHGAVTIHDAVYHAGFRAALLEAIRTRAQGAVAGEGSAWLDGVVVPEGSRVLGVEQSNTSIVYGERLFLKLFRRLQPGVNPDAEISRFLGARGFRHTPPFAGTLELLVGGEATPFGLMLGVVENRGDAWSWALEQVRRYFAENAPVPLEQIALLGERTAQLHLALLAGGGPDFGPEPLTRADFEELAAGVRARLDHVFAALRRSDDPLGAEVLAHEEAARARIAALAQAPLGAVKMRHHGDYHLGQVLATDADWMIIDFEGEPLRPLVERRAKRSPLRDVAGMLRSFHYAAHAARPENEPIAMAEAWCEAASAAFLDRYLAVTHGAAFLPKSSADRDALLAAFVIEKALYEIDYELNNRPAWLGIPLRGLLATL